MCPRTDNLQLTAISDPGDQAMEFCQQPTHPRAIKERRRLASLQLTAIRDLGQPMLLMELDVVAQLKGAGPPVDLSRKRTNLPGGTRSFVVSLCLTHKSDMSTGKLGRS